MQVLVLVISLALGQHLDVLKFVCGLPKKEFFEEQALPRPKLACASMPL